MTEKAPRQSAQQLARYLAPIFPALACRSLDDEKWHEWAERLDLTSLAAAQMVVRQLERLDSDHQLRHLAATLARTGESERGTQYSSLLTKLEHRLRAEPEVRGSLWSLLTVYGNERRPPRPRSMSPTGARKRDRDRRRGLRPRRLYDWVVRTIAVLGMLAITGVTVVALLWEPTMSVAGVNFADLISPLNLFTIFVIVVLAFLPGWLFVRFIKQRGRALWDEYVIHLHRLGLDEPQFLPEPPRSSGYFDDWASCGGPIFSRRTVYRDKFNAYYGRHVSEAVTGSDPVRTEALFPVFLLTAILAIGWTEILRNDRLTEAPETALDVLEFGFLGAYLFVVQMLVRRFFQSDLKASAYASAIVRIISVIAIVLVMHQLPLFQEARAEEAVVAFVIGFFPLVGMQALQRTTSVVLRLAVPSLRSDYPLSDLDGLNIWYEARLLEEGIEDMESLISANMVDVILHTRVPVGRLVDWIDQAHLYLRLPPPQRWRQQRRDQRSAMERGDFSEPRNLLRDVLRGYGVHNATEFLRLFFVDKGLPSTLSPDSGTPVGRGGSQRPTGAEAEGTGEGLYDWQNDTWPRKLAKRIEKEARTDEASIMALVRVLATEPGLVHVHSWRSWLPTSAKDGRNPAPGQRRRPRGEAAGRMWPYSRQPRGPRSREWSPWWRSPNGSPVGSRPTGDGSGGSGPGAGRDGELAPVGSSGADRRPARS